MRILQILVPSLLLLLSLRGSFCADHPSDISTSSTVSSVHDQCHHGSHDSHENPNNVTRADDDDAHAFNVADATTTPEGKEKIHHRTQKSVPDDCALVMTHSSIPNSGWGVFTLRPKKRGDPVLMKATASGVVGMGDIVIQIPDLHRHLAHGVRRLVWEYLWDRQETLGSYEGYHVMSAVPGIGMLANGEGTNVYNALPEVHRPMVDNAGLSPQSSPGAGAFTHYHNLTWIVQRDLEPGEEILVNYGPGWFKERGLSQHLSNRPRASVEQLRDGGYCLDNLQPGLSTLSHAGRGAFATRALSLGSVVAPVPLLPVSSESLLMTKVREEVRGVHRMENSQQLLRNYCFGHPNSTLLLFPYSPMINLINHAPSEEVRHEAGGHCTSRGTSDPSAQHHLANVRVEWTASSRHIFERPVELLQESTSRLLLELVAVRDIEEGEEILLDYGDDWQAAWNEHVNAWVAARIATTPLMEPSSSHEMNHIMHTLRTIAEQEMDPYPENVFTSCYYGFSHQGRDDNSLEQAWMYPVTRAVWNSSKDVYENRHLRPCLILKRHIIADGIRNGVSEKGGQHLHHHHYTVRVMNRPGLTESERIPQGVHLVVTGVPRAAIRFSDKIYTTDQHLESAFRHHIGLVGEVFPKQWMDLMS
jgi:hypothetical protein